MKTLRATERLTRTDRHGKEELAEIVDRESERAIDEVLVNEALSGDREIRAIEQQSTARRRPRHHSGE